MATSVPHNALANAIRALAIDAVEEAASGHPGLPMGAADIATVLYRDVLKFDAADPSWPDRDRFVLSAGHGSMLLYALFYLLGVPGMTMEEIKAFRQLGSKTPGHPEYGDTPGVEVTTGPLGQGLGTAVGMAIAAQSMRARFGGELVDHKIYVLASDGDLMEGISHEAISLAGHLQLRDLIVLFDDNAVSIDGSTELAESGDMLARFQAAGWLAERIDGHDPQAIADGLMRAKIAERPSLIACRTTIGYGAPKKAGTAAAHGAPLGAEEAAAAKAALGWTAPPFTVPDDILQAWRAIGRGGAEQREAWNARLAASTEKEAFQAAMGARVDADVRRGARRRASAQAVAKGKGVATRKSSQAFLGEIIDHVPFLIGGSADLSGSNGTKTEAMTVLAKPGYDGCYIHYGVREHAMAAAMNGMALHGGVRPYGGTFLVFSDYCRPAIRMAALMGLPVIYVFTHDSIGLGEDGPTHQPIEHLAALRAIPNLLVMRPADAVETAECWDIALAQTSRPAALVLSRQDTPLVRTGSEEREPEAGRGGYVVKAENADLQIVLAGSGTEVGLAMEAGRSLEAQGIGTRVVSVPSFELLREQDPAYRSDLFSGAPVIAVEASNDPGWHALIGRLDGFVGMAGFGASGPYRDLYEHFGLTPEHIVEEALRVRARGGSHS